MKVCIQAGHKNVTTGATGAPGERDWNSKIVPMIASKLRSKGVEVYETDAKGDSTVTGTDWDLFLAIHYDADIYNDRGGFYDYPDKSIDQVYETSKKLSTVMGEHYFKTTGIPLKLGRSNANTKFYYMWSQLTAKTPCAILECGVGNRKPQDYEILRDYEFISKTISDGILMALGLYDSSADKLAECQTKCQELSEDLDKMRESRNSWRDEAKDYKKKYEALLESSGAEIKRLQGDLAYVEDIKNQLSASLDFCKENEAKLDAKATKLAKDLETCKEKLVGCFKKVSKKDLLMWILFGR